MKWSLIDGIGPFFRGVERKRINWSKMPFSDMEQDGRLRHERVRGWCHDFELVCRRASETGFNAITLDDLAHLYIAETYSEGVRSLLQDYQTLYTELIAIARRHGLAVFVTADVFSSPIDAPSLNGDLGKILATLREACEQVFDELDIAGIIFRIGESDGLDVHGTFRSELVLKHSTHVRRFIEGLLPVFESRDREFVLRTWTVGAYPVGDLQWNRETFDACFEGLDSPNFAISMKYGESDFFRYLPLNKLFFRSSHRKFVELQARREYEGCGEYPSFVGLDYQAYQEQLEGAENVVGLSVWCQTGGWTTFRRLTYLDPEGVWNEINTHVALRIFKHGETAQEAVMHWHTRNRPHTDFESTWELLRLSSEVVSELLYVRDFAQQKLFFRRLRIPPLISASWDHILVTHSLRKVLRNYTRDPHEAVREGHAALGKITRMREHAIRADLPVDDVEFMQHTYKLLSLAREYFFLPFSEERTDRLCHAKWLYKDRYPRGSRYRYTIHTDFKKVRLSKRRIGQLLSVALRRQRGYRLIDQILFVRLLAILHPVISWTSKKLVPAYARDQAMGIETILR